MAHYQFRQATPNDIPSLVDFNCSLARETEDQVLDRQLVERGVARAFEQGDEATYFVAVPSGESQPIGALMLTREWSDWRDGWLVWLQSVYVSENHRGMGVFSALLEHATQEVRKNPDVHGLRLYMENDNVRAQSVYLKNGFVDPNYRVLEKIF